ncbi:MAG: hypothetical protein ACK4N5_26555, partial [Myxococcales bacterium]
VVCPPPVRCAPGQPCAQEGCHAEESDARDSIKNELFVMRLGPDGSGAELLHRHEVATRAPVHVIGFPQMSAVGTELVIAFQAGDFEVRRLQLDTSALRPIALAAGSVAESEVELVPGSP